MTKINEKIIAAAKRNAIGNYFTNELADEKTYDEFVKTGNGEELTPWEPFEFSEMKWLRDRVEDDFNNYVNFAKFAIEASESEEEDYSIFIKNGDDGVEYFLAGEIIDGKINGIVYACTNSHQTDNWYIFQDKYLPLADIDGEAICGDQAEGLLETLVNNKSLLKDLNKLIDEYLMYNAESDCYVVRDSKIQLFNHEGCFSMGDIQPISFEKSFFDKEANYMTLEELRSALNWQNVLKKCLESQIDMDRCEEEPLSNGTLVENAVMSFTEDIVYMGLVEEQNLREYLEKIVNAIEERYDSSGLTSTAITECEICDDCGEVLLPDDETYEAYDGRVLCGHCSIRWERCDRYFVSGEIVQDINKCDVCHECLAKDTEMEIGSVWKLEQFNIWFNYDSRVLFGVYNSEDDARNAVNQFEKLYKGFLEDVYESSRNQWTTDKFEFGVKITEVQTNTFGEL